MTDMDADQLAASKAIHRIARMNMPVLIDACGEEDADLAGTVVLPIMYLAAVRDGTLIGSAVFYDDRLTKTGIVAVIRRSAERLEAGDLPTTTYGMGGQA